MLPVRSVCSLYTQIGVQPPSVVLEILLLGERPHQVKASWGNLASAGQLDSSLSAARMKEDKKIRI
jgi:hypothetical protein